MSHLVGRERARYTQGTAKGPEVPAGKALSVTCNFFWEPHESTPNTCTVSLAFSQDCSSAIFSFSLLAALQAAAKQLSREEVKTRLCVLQVPALQTTGPARLPGLPPPQSVRYVTQTVFN